MIGLATLIVLVAWNSLRPKALKSVPGPLVAAVVAAVLAAIWELPIDYIAVPDNLVEVLSFPGKHTLQSWTNPNLVWAAVALALVASAETLLCATAVSKMHNEGRTNYDRELASQGLGNLLCGLAGCLPITGVISRSTMNVDAGAKTRKSAILHAGWVLLFVALFPDVLALVPTSSLAAILVYVGYKLVDINAIRKLSSFGRSVLLIYFATVVGIVAIDLLSGIVLGLTISSLKLMWSFSHLDIQVEQDTESKRIDMRLYGSATFVGLPTLAEALEDVPGGVELHMHIEYLDYIDHACLDVISDWQQAHEKDGGRVIIEWNTLMNRFRRRSGSGTFRSVDMTGSTLDVTKNPILGEEVDPPA
jgi:MFS superfamily sulfate permease-like transporter